MSLPSISATRPVADHENDPNNPPALPKPSGATGEPVLESDIQLASKKRKRDPKDETGVSGASSGDRDSEASSVFVKAPSTEPAWKRRRVPQENKKFLQSIRKNLSEVLANGDMAALKQALAAHPGCLNQKHPDNRATLLLEALWLQQFDMAKWLLESGANPNIDAFEIHFQDFEKGEYGMTEAFRQRWLPLPASAARVEDRDGYILRGDPLLHTAIYGMEEWVELLLAKGAIVNTTDKFRLTPLMGAVISGSLSVVEMILRNGADPTVIKDHHGTGIGMHAGWLALYYSESAIFRAMIHYVPPEKQADFILNSLTTPKEGVSIGTLLKFYREMPEFSPVLDGAKTASGNSSLLDRALKECNLDVVTLLAEQNYSYRLST